MEIRDEKCLRCSWSGDRLYKHCDECERKWKESAYKALEEAQKARVMKSQAVCTCCKVHGPGGPRY